ALGATAPSRIDFGPMLWALVLLAGVLLTLKPKLRPGYLNVLFTPSFLLSLVLSTVGAVVVRWVLERLGIGAADFAGALTLPIPDWDRIVFGRGKLASPIF